MVSLESELLLFLEGQLDSAGGEEGDDGLLALSDDEHVVDSCGEIVAVGVLDVGDVKVAGVLLDVLQHSNSSNIVSSGGDDQGSVFKLNKAFNFRSL